MNKERGERKVYARPETHEFLKAAIAEGTREDAWIRQRNLLFSYYGTPESLPMIANAYGVTKQNIHQTVQKGLQNLWENCNPRLKSQFPFEEIKGRKPFSLKVRERKSLAKSGLLARVKELVEKGASVEEIKDEVGRIDLTGTRIRLREWGVELPYLTKPHNFNPRLERGIRTAQSDEEVQKLLDQVNRGFLNRIRGQESPPVLAPLTIARSVGYHFWGSRISALVKVIKEAGIPLGVIKQIVPGGPQKGEKRYYFIATQHKGRLIQALNERPSLRKFLKKPVRLICGQPEKIPTTWQLLQRQNFISPAHIFRELGIAEYNFHLRQAYPRFFTDDCPVPIFKLHTNYFYPAEREEELREYIRQKIS